MERKSVQIDDDFHVVDHYSRLGKRDLSSKKTKTFWKSLKSYIKRDVSVVVVYLALLGALTSLVSLGTDWSIDNVEKTREFVSSLTPFYILNFGLYILYTALFAALAVASMYISPFAGGSGIPPLKSMIGGIIMNRYLYFSTLVSKILGLICAFGAGLSIGREGPFCHISGCIAYLLMKLNIFSHIRKMDGERRQMLAASTAAGVSSVFGAPFGGLIFSIEVTSAYFPVGNLWKSLFAALTSSLLFSIWRYIGIKGTQQFTQFEEHSFHPFEYLCFGMEGIIMGLLGALFVSGSLFVLRMQKTLPAIKDRPMLVVVGFALFSSLIGFHIDPGLKGTGNKILSYLYRLPLDQWDTGLPFFHLIIACVGRYFLTMVAVTLPIPAGVFTPCFITGAALGRLMGEVVNFSSKLVGFGPVNPLGYSVVGAAAFASGVTRTLSTAVIMFEITGQIRFLVPTLIATVLANPVGNFFNKSFYFEMMHVKGIPNPEISHLDKKDTTITADDLMKKDVIVFESTANSHDIQRGIDSHQDVFPIVENMQNMILLGSVTLEAIKKAEMDDFQEKIVFSNEFDGESDNRIGYDPSPFVVLAKTSLERIHYLFSILSLSYSIVVFKGQVVGILYKRDLIKLDQLESIDVVLDQSGDTMEMVEENPEEQISDAASDESLITKDV